MTPLLRLVVELTVDEPSGVPPTARPALEALAARSGETAKLAKRLLGRASDGHTG
jgi:hypothetical protein